LNLIECLLRIAETGFQSTVLEIFKFGIQRSGELIFLGLVQLHVKQSRIQNVLFVYPIFMHHFRQYGQH